MRILLLTRHYPPAVSGGAKRPFLLAHALRRRGAEVFVVAPSLPDNEPGAEVPHPYRDPPTASSAARPAFSPRAVAREWLLWPDPDIRWCMQATQAAAEQAPWTPNWVWTTSPPESIHAAGARLARRFGARWLLDFRDHWLERPHRRERLALHRRIGEAALARRWLSSADLTTCVDASIQAELRRLGAKDPKILPHFSPNCETTPMSLPEGDINVVHTGSIALSDPLARIEEMLGPFEVALVRNPALRLHLVGRLTASEQAAIARSKAASRISIHGVQSLAESLGFQRAADGLILIGSPKTHVPPSKITEYLATNAPIIACGQGDWRADPRLDGADPAEALAALRKGAVRPHRFTVPSLDGVADQLMAWLRT